MHFLTPHLYAQLELAFKQGDIIYIVGDMDEDGFYSGELGNLRGLVPSNFLQDAPEEDEDEVLESASMVSPSRSAGSISAASRLSDSATTVNNVGDRVHGHAARDAAGLHAPCVTGAHSLAAAGASPGNSCAVFRCVHAFLFCFRKGFHQSSKHLKVHCSMMAANSDDNNNLKVPTDFPYLPCFLRHFFRWTLRVVRIGFS